ncbi:MAG: hypothetical protein UU22_C0015G0006 [Parcubacteria group bacterium GW2011_GWA2_40_8]|nr:MAG: hypothetical protein UT82_C0008G0039 [Parcubacteria group bacterium GW2011_GWB1_40_14]KKR78729.1 MAG: hypothetical protein UU22_C0015G0006 [Parcubacteria group bacterium GW2011_GWA2_40_8]
MGHRVCHDSKRLVIDNLALFTQRGFLHWCALNSSPQFYVTRLATPVGELFIYIEISETPSLIISKDSWTDVIYADKNKYLDELINAVRVSVAEETPPALPKTDVSWPQDADQTLYILQTFRRLTAR